MAKTPERHHTATQGTQAIHKVEARQLTSRTYNHEWRRLRRWFLDQHPLCIHCEAEGKITEANEVDHITPVKLAPYRRLDPTNLQSLCKSHHSMKTASENAGRHF